MLVQVDLEPLSVGVVHDDEGDLHLAVGGGGDVEEVRGVPVPRVAPEVHLEKGHPLGTDEPDAPDPAVVPEGHGVDREQVKEPARDQDGEERFPLPLRHAADFVNRGGQRDRQSFSYSASSKPPYF